MPRAGGEADKLGNRYEAIWTVDTLLDLLAGRVVSVIIESLDEDEARGAEFITTLPDGTKEFHSVKRQKSGSEWSPASLCMASETGRSILGDLFEKQRRSRTRSVRLLGSWDPPRTLGADPAFSGSRYFRASVPNLG